MFVVSGAANQLASLALAVGTTSPATGSGTDYGAASGTGLEYWNGTAWTAYTSGTVSLNANGKLLVRTPITNDTIADNNETFKLSATNTGGTAGTGTATIKDDGTGTLFTNGNPTGDTPPSNPNGPFNDDRPIGVTSISVNEGSPYAVFQVSTVAGQELTLTLAPGTATGSGTDYGATGATNLQVSVDGGATWTNYGSNVTVPASGLVLVRTPITSDTISDNNETFTLTASNTSGVSSAGTATIKDDGTGTIFNNDGTPNDTAAKDDDRPLTVSSVTVNEGSPYAVVTVKGAPGQKVTLASADGTAGSADYGPGLEVFDGSQWVPYTPGSTVLLNAQGELLVRTPVKADTLSEGSETFTVRAGNVSGSTFSGTVTIRDDGQGDIFKNDGSADTAMVKDDDRPLSVNSISISESSPYAVFKVTGQPGQLMTLSLASGTATLGQDTPTDQGPLEIFNGTTWVAYTPGSRVAVPAGATALLVRTAIVNDSRLEGAETFTLKATNTGGTAASGTATVYDDGTVSNVFEADNTTPTATVGSADNDQPPAIIVALAPAPAPPPPVVTTPVVSPPPPPPTQFIAPTSPIVNLVTPSRPVDASLIVTRSVPDQFVESGGRASFNLPPDAFKHSNPGEQLQLSASQANGTALPAWLRFDPRSGTFQGTPPPGLATQLQIKVTARDSQGREVTAIFKVVVGGSRVTTGGQPAGGLAAERAGPMVQGGVVSTGGTGSGGLVSPSGERRGGEAPAGGAFNDGARPGIIAPPDGSFRPGGAPAGSTRPGDGSSGPRSSLTEQIRLAGAPR